MGDWRHGIRLRDATRVLAGCDGNSIHESAAMATAIPHSNSASHPPSRAQVRAVVCEAQLEMGVAQLIRTTPAVLFGLVASCALVWWAIGDRLSVHALQVQLWLAMAVFAAAVRTTPLVLRLIGKQAWISAHLRQVAICIVLGSALIGLSVLVMPLLNWSLMTLPEQSMMVGVIVGIVTIGAMTMAPIPFGAYLWLTLVGSVLIGFAVQIGIPKMQWVAWAVVAWCLFLAFIARQFGNSFRELISARADAARHSEMVALLLQDFGEEARDWLWETGEGNKLSFASARMADALGTQVSALQGRTLEDALCDAVDANDTESPQAKLRVELIQRFKRQLAFRNQTIEYVSRGQRRWVSLSAKPLHGTLGELVGWRGTGIDVTQEFQRQREMERLATSDSLTGLANRFVLSQTLESVFASVGEVKPCALFLLDLDDFKLINDHFGHPTGDRVLQLVAERLTQHVRPGQLLVRLGGDEFAVVAPGDVPRARLAEMGERLLNSIAEPFIVDGISMSVRCSVGIAIAGVDAHDAKSLLKCADLALYATKGAGRNGMRFFGFDMYRKVEDRFTLAEEMRRALDNDEFELVYQPFVRTQTRELTGFEALVRWNHPERGMLYPDEFVPVAEETGLIARIGVWVLNTACADAQAWPVAARVSVNVSPAQFASTNVLDAVNDALKSSHLPAHRLELEITESALFSDGCAARRTMQSLRDRGVHISLDDFGAGHASLNHLRTFPISRLKIDRSFTNAVADTTREGNEARSIVRAAIELARAMDLESTAEGVENAAQFDVLKSLYCDEVQGYEISYPMTRPALNAYFEGLTQRLSEGAPALRLSLSA
jgi:diguanylate cyclase (GGDEF)-like protein